jgi:uncharacterized membrane protein HdeD (DUF308 family)
MALAALDLRWLTSGSLFVIGAALTFWAMRIYWMHPHRRADLLGPYIKVPGSTAILRALPALFVLGLFLIIAGVSKGVYYMRWNGDVGNELANAVGVIEAVLSIWAASSVMAVTVRACVRK